MIVKLKPCTDCCKYLCSKQHNISKLFAMFTSGIWSIPLNCKPVKPILHFFAYEAVAKNHLITDCTVVENSRETSYQML